MSLAPCDSSLFLEQTFISPHQRTTVSPLTAAEPFYMRLGSSSVAFSSQNLPKLAATSVENVVKALHSHRWTATVRRIFEILFSQWLSAEKRQKKRKRVWDTHTPARTGRTSRRNSGSSRTGTSCRRDGPGGHMAGSCTPDWTSYLEQQRTAAQTVGGKYSGGAFFLFFLPFLSWIFAHNLVKKKQ